MRRAVIGTAALLDAAATEAKQFQVLGFRVAVEEIAHPDGRVVVIHIPGRPLGSAFRLNGACLMIVGESVVPMAPDRLGTIFAEAEITSVTQTHARATNELTERIASQLLMRSTLHTQHSCQILATLPK